MFIIKIDTKISFTPIVYIECDNESELKNKYRELINSNKFEKDNITVFEAKTVILI